MRLGYGGCWTGNVVTVKFTLFPVVADHVLDGV